MATTKTYCPVCQSVLASEAEETGCANSNCPYPLKPETDAINPKHYKIKSRTVFEVADVIEMFGLDWHLGTAAKYLLRAGKKDPDKYVEDLDKAIWYIRRSQRGHHESKSK